MATGDWVYIPGGKRAKGGHPEARQGRIVALYPHVVLVDFGRYRECFSYDEVRAV